MRSIARIEIRKPADASGVSVRFKSGVAGWK